MEKREQVSVSRKNTRAMQEGPEHLVRVGATKYSSSLGKKNVRHGPRRWWITCARHQCDVARVTRLPGASLYQTTSDCRLQSEDETY